MMALIRQSKYAEAKAAALELLDLRRRLLPGGDHVDIAKSLRILGEVYQGLNDKDKAQENQNLAKEIDKKPRGAQHSWNDPKDDLRLVDIRRVLDKSAEGRQGVDKNQNLLRLGARVHSWPANPYGQGPLATAATVIASRLDLAFVPKLKAEAKQTQLHYLLYVSLDATDNNVETGPSTTKGKLPIKFLIVSDVEFLSQIAEDEDVLSEQLEKAEKSLVMSRDRLNELMDRLARSTATYEDVKSRAALAQTYLTESSNLTKEVFKEYERILKHLEFNQARIDRGLGFEEGFGAVADKFKKVRDHIHDPLRDLVNEERRTLKEKEVDFPTTESAAYRLLTSLDNKGVIPSEDLLKRYRADTADCRDKVVRLLTKMNKVLIEIKSVVTEAMARDMLNRLAKEERERAAEMADIYRRLEQAELDALINPKK